MSSEQVDNLLARLEKVRKSGRGWMASCPAHPDSDPSMMVSIGDNGGIVLFDHGGCQPEDIVRSIGLTMMDLAPPDLEVKKPATQDERIYYDYHDQDGELVFQVVRTNKADGTKDFRQRQPDGAGGWIWTATGIEKPLYRLPQVLRAIANGGEVWVAEGEKDVEALEGFGLTATTSPGGAKKWMPHHTKSLRGANVVITVDKDKQGYLHGLQVAEALEDIAESVRVVAPPVGNDAAEAIGKGVSPGGFETVNLVDLLDLHDPFRDAIGEIKDLAGNDRLTLEQKLSRANHILDKKREVESSGEFGRLVDWPSFLAGPAESYDWIIPDLLEHGERVIVVAAEGAGKTMLARQMAIMSAAGVHPFKRTKIDPVRTLFVDLENPEKIIRRTSKKIIDSVRMVHGLPTDMNAHLLVKPDGANLLDAGDRYELESVIEATEPDIIFLGPLYKSYIEQPGRDSMSTIKELVMYLDRIRDTYGITWWLEHHAPLGSNSDRTLRPVDSGVWSRWPEFGLSLYPDPTAAGTFELRHFRGQRDQREWPAYLTRGTELPFIANY